MNFKECIKEDLNVTFFNENEFAEIHNYNGNDTPIVIDDDKLLELQTKGYNDGISTCTKLIYVKESDIEEPFIEQRVSLDNEMFSVKSIQSTEGMYTIMLGEYES